MYPTGDTSSARGAFTDADLDEIEREYSGWRSGDPKAASTILSLLAELRDARRRLAEAEQKKSMLRSDAGGRRPVFRR